MEKKNARHAKLKGWSANLNGETKRQIAQLNHQLQARSEEARSEERDLLSNKKRKKINRKSEFLDLFEHQVVRSK